jgi:antirestriction protein ArdC
MKFRAADMLGGQVRGGKTEAMIEAMWRFGLAWKEV